MHFVPDHAVVAAKGAAPTRTAFMLHGILGQGRNWRSFAGRVVRARPDWRIVTVDLRNHGRSQGAAPPHTLATTAADLVDLAAVVGEPDAVIGHSFGGKVALAYAEREPGVGQVWVLDSRPGRAEVDELSDDVLAVLSALHTVPVPLGSRDDLHALFAAKGFSPMLSQWMATNLEWTPDGYRWVFELTAIEEMLASYFDTDLWPVIEGLGPRAHVVRAGRGGRWHPGAIERLHATGASDHVLPNAGHWLHMDDPDGLLAIVARALP